MLQLENICHFNFCSLRNCLFQFLLPRGTLLLFSKETDLHLHVLTFSLSADHELCIGAVRRGSETAEDNESFTLTI